jgi:hypothetical protein
MSFVASSTRALVKVLGKSSAPPLSGPATMDSLLEGVVEEHLA